MLNLKEEGARLGDSGKRLCARLDDVIELVADRVIRKVFRLRQFQCSSRIFFIYLKYRGSNSILS